MPTTSTTPSSSKKGAKRRSSAAATSAGASAPAWPKCELTGLHFYIADEKLHKLWAATAATGADGATTRPPFICQTTFITSLRLKLG